MIFSQLLKTSLFDDVKSYIIYTEVGGSEAVIYSGNRSDIPCYYLPGIVSHFNYGDARLEVTLSGVVAQRTILVKAKSKYFLHVVTCRTGLLDEDLEKWLKEEYTDGNFEYVIITQQLKWRTLNDKEI